MPSSQIISDTMISNEICENGLNYLSSNGKKLGIIICNENGRRLGYTHNGNLWANITFRLERAAGYSQLLFDPIEYNQTTVEIPSDIVHPIKKMSKYLYIIALKDANRQYITNINDLTVQNVSIDNSESMYGISLFPRYVFNAGSKFYIKDLKLSSGFFRREKNVFSISSEVNII